VGFAASFSFKYNDRPGVRAARMEPKVPEAVKTERLARPAGPAESWPRPTWPPGGLRIRGVLRGASRKPGVGAPPSPAATPVGRTVNVADGRGNDLTGLLGRVRIDKAKKHSLTGTHRGGAMVEMKVSRPGGCDEDSQVPVLILKDLEEKQVLPIRIGATECHGHLAGPKRGQDDPGP
jgi:hypothetical protein